MAISNKLSIIFFVCFICGPAFAVGAQNKNDSDIVSVKNVNGFTFAYRKCWRVSALELEDISQDDSIAFHPTSECQKEYGGAWIMEISPVGTYTNEEYEKERSEIYPEIYRDDRNVGKYKAIVFGGISRESSQLINMESQKNLHWVLKVNCKKMNVRVAYTDYLEKSARDETRKNPKIPPPFQFLIDHFSCE